MTYNVFGGTLNFINFNFRKNYSRLLLLLLLLLLMLLTWPFTVISDEGSPVVPNIVKTASDFKGSSNSDCLILHHVERSVSFAASSVAG